MKFGKTIENFGNGFGIGNNVSFSAEENNKLKLATEANLSEENINKNMQSLLNETISNTILKNSSDIQAYVEQVNNFNVSFSSDNPDCPPIEKVSITNVNQTVTNVTEATNNLKNEVEQKISSEIKNDVRTTVIKLSDMFDSGLDFVNSFPEVMEAGFEGAKNMGSSVDTVFSEALAGAGIGNKFESEKTVNNDMELKNKLGMKDSDTITDDTEAANKIEQSLSLENIQTILTEVVQANNFTINVGQCTKSAVIDDIEQLNKNDMKIESSTLNTIVTELSNTLTSNISKIFSKIADKAENHKAVAELALATGMGIVASGGNYTDSNGKTVHTSKPVLPGDLCNENANNNCVSQNDVKNNPKIAEPTNNQSNTFDLNTLLENKMVLYGVAGLFGFIILLIIIKAFSGGGGDDYYYDDYYYHKNFSSYLN